jgi:hypothetical protein
MPPRARVADEVGVVIVDVKTICAEIKNLMTSGAELCNQLRFQVKSAMVSGYAYTYTIIPAELSNVLARQAQSSLIVSDNDIPARAVPRSDIDLW